MARDMREPPHVSVLLVCTGNICRSPTAEGVLRHHVRERGLEGRIVIASAGTQDYHVGEAPDPRAVKYAGRRGYDLSALRAAHLTLEDFERHDYILAMDRSHLRWMQQMAPAGSRARLGLFLEGSARWKGEDVPDPYYGSVEAFELVLDMVEEAAARWVDRFAAELDPGAFRLQEPG